MQANCEPKQRLRKTAKKVVINKEESSSEEENKQILTRRSVRDRQPTERYRYRDLNNNKESN